MKFYLIAVCAFLLTQNVQGAPEWDSQTYFKYLSERVDEIRSKCEELTGATDDDVEALDEGKIPETETGKCLIACEFMEYGIIDENKKYNKNGVFDMLPEYIKADKSLDGFRKLTERCEKAVEKVDKDDECELARKLKLCFKNHASEYGIKNMIGMDDLTYKFDY